jgi:hypothetical protein
MHYDVIFETDAATGINFSVNFDGTNNSNFESDRETRKKKYATTG